MSKINMLEKTIKKLERSLNEGKSDTGYMEDALISISKNFDELDTAIDQLIKDMIDSNENPNLSYYKQLNKNLHNNLDKIYNEFSKFRKIIMQQINS